MGLFDKVKKAIGGGTPPAQSGGSGGQKSGGQGGQGGQKSGGQGGRSGQGGQRSQGGNRNQRGSQRADGEGGDGSGSGQGAGSGSGRRRGSRGGRGRGGQGQGQGQGQGGQRQQNQSGQQSDTATTPRDGAEGAAGTGSSANRRRRRGGRGRGSGSSGGQGGGQGTTRTVTRSNAAELKEQQEKDGTASAGSGRSGGQRSGGGQRKKSGSRSRGGQGGGQGGGKRRERTRRGSSSSGSRRRVLDANERPKDPVKKQILINASDPNEIRVAIREQQKVVEVYVERKGKRSLAGNIYKGRVQNVLRGMEAAFVDIGLERNGFLYVDEITPAAADSDQIMKVTMVTEMGSGSADAPATSGAAAPSEVGAEGSDVADVDVEDDAQAGAVEVTVVEPAATPGEAMARAAADNDETLDIGDAMEEVDREAAEAEAAAAAAAAGEEEKDTKSKGRGRARIQNKKKIQDLLKPGQEILCQVVKDPMGTKGSRLTTQYSLAGRYLVYVPDGEGLGVSRRLEDAERNRLRDIVKQFELPMGGGLIVRTAAEGALEEDIAKDLQLLLHLHGQLMDKAGQARAPKLLYNEADLSLRIIRDLMNDEVEEVLVDDERQYQRIMNYLKRTSPILAERVRMHDGQRPVFESYGVEEAIRSTLSKRAELVSGGYLIIDKTEAFHVIDVNTGRNVGTASLEETITKTNMEAAEEVVRQLRLRDLGGIIVIDFIDMNLMKNRDNVLEHFRKELSKDRTKTYLVEISPLGLVEMTRQNVSEGVREILTSTCRSCEGRGVVVSAETHAIEVERAVVELAAGLGDDVEAVAIETQPDVARVLAGNSGKQGDLNRRAGKSVRVFGDPDLTPNTFAVRATGEIAHVEALAEPLLRGTKHKVLIERVDPACEDDGIAVVDGVLVTVIGAGSAVGEERTILIAASAGGRAFATLVKPARRRRRRGGRGRRKATVAAGTAGASGEDVDLDDDELEDGEELDEDGDEFEDVDDDEGDDDAAGVEEADDGRAEIPERFVMLEEDDPDLDVADEDEDDQDEDDGEDDGDDPDDDPDGDDDDTGGDSDSGSDADDSDADDASDSADGDDEGSAGSGEEQVADDIDDEDAVADEDSSIDASAWSHDDADETPLARRVPDADHDEPSIDPEGGDDLLEARGVSVPAGERPVSAATSTPADDSDESNATAGGSTTASGAPRRRRRGSRGGRNRSRSGGGGGQGANRQSDGSGTGTGTGSGSGGASSGGSASSDG